MTALLFTVACPVAALCECARFVYVAWDLRRRWVVRR